VAQVSEVMDEIVAGEERQRQGMEQINTAIELRQLVSAYALTGARPRAVEYEPRLNCTRPGRPLAGTPATCGTQ